MTLSLDLSTLTTPISLRPATALTDEELIRFSEINKLYKIERNNRGEITIMTPVGGIGGTHEIFIATALFNWTESADDGIAFGPNAGFNLRDGSCLAPDAAWLSLFRWNALTLHEQTEFPPLCSEFIIEVRTRSDSRGLVEAKMQLWLDNGAQLAWLVDPTDANVTIYRPDEAEVTLQRSGSVAGTGPVEGFILRTSRLWPQRG